MRIQEATNLSVRIRRGELRKRFYNHPAARQSSELEVVGEHYAVRIRREALTRAQCEARRRRSELDVISDDDYAAMMMELSGPPRWGPIPIESGGLKIKSIVDVARKHFRLTEVELLAHRRAVNIVRPRQIIWYIAKTHTRMSYPQIGMRVGGFDHTTVLHGVRTIQGYLAVNDEHVGHDVGHIENTLCLR
jgi:hypothetical protein